MLKLSHKRAPAPDPGPAWSIQTRRSRRQADNGKAQLPKVVLFATASVQPAAASLHRAQTLAEQLRAGLMLLSVVPVRELRTPFINVSDHPSALESFVDVARSATDHLRAVLRQRYTEERHTLKVGGFFDHTRAYARELGARLIVLNAAEHSGKRVTALARASGCPVLVARAPVHPISMIVAATDLKYAGFPVLRRACELRACCGSRLLCVHHLSGARRTPRAALWSVIRADRERKRREACRLLARVCHNVGAEVVLTRPSQDTEQATLELARSVSADLIVVGTGVRSALQRSLRHSVSAGIVDHSACSVLVTPLH